MDYRYLGRTGIRVSPLCIGTMTYGARTDQAEADHIVAHAIEAGINFFDTANVYAHGESEIVLGKSLKKTGKRDQLVIATKCHGNMHKDSQLNPNRWGNSRRQIIEQANASLKRLDLDYIDLYQIHRPHPDCPIDETLRALDDLVRTGKVRYIGCSTFAAWQVIESLWCSQQYNLNRFVTEQPPYHLLDRRIERELIPAAQTYGLGIIPWSPLAGGFLTGKYQRGQSTQDSRYSNADAGRAPSILNNDRAFDVLDELTQLASEKICNVTQLSLSWCMNQPGITSPIIGPRSLEQLKDNLAALNVTLNEQDHQRIDKVSPPGRAIEPYYESHFGPHPHRW